MTRSFHNAKLNKTPESWNKFLENRQTYQTKILEAKEAYENTKFDFLSSNRQNNPKTWWSILKSVYRDDGCVDSIPPLEVEDNLITDDKAKAEAFNNFFLKASQLDDKDAVLPDNIRLFDDGTTLTTINITKQDVIDQIKDLDSTKSYGPDGISPVFLKEGGETIVNVMHKLFTMSIHQSKFPSSFKKANVVPIHKKDKKTKIPNYRPISLLSILSKVFEKIIFKYVYNFFRENFVLSVFQSGFQAGKSTVTQLLEVYHKFCEAVDNNKEIRVVFLDISKAFDKVWHKGLLFKLQQAGIGGGLLRWFESYLRDRLQRVVINGQTSAWGPIQSGVPQGSVLGPLLFLLFIDDIVNVVTQCQIRLFADDTCLFIEVDNRERTAELINADLVQIQNWANRWLVTFSPTKTKSLIISNKDDAILNPQVELNGHAIDEVDSHTYLGLKFSRNLSWSHHNND